MPATILYGADGNPLIPQSKAIVEPSFGALRTVLKPLDYVYGNVVGGHYRVGIYLNGGLTALAANAPILAFRWAPSGANALIAVPLRVSAYAVITTAGSAAFTIDLEVVRATSFTVQDTAGVSLSLAGGINRMRTGMAASQADIRYANGTAALAAGTRTLDGNSMGGAIFYTQPAAGVIGPASALAGPLDLYKMDESGVQHPLVLGVAEGFVVRVPTAFGTAAVIRYYLVLEWVETPVF
jgi:hypothetical protein